MGATIGAARPAADCSRARGMYARTQAARLTLAPPLGPASQAAAPRGAPGRLLAAGGAAAAGHAGGGGGGLPPHRPAAAGAGAVPARGRRQRRGARRRHAARAAGALLRRAGSHPPPGPGAPPQVRVCCWWRRRRRRRVCCRGASPLLPRTPLDCRAATWAAGRACLTPWWRRCGRRARRRRCGSWMWRRWRRTCLSWVRGGGHAGRVAAPPRRSLPTEPLHCWPPHGVPPRRQLSGRAPLSRAPQLKPSSQQPRQGLSACRAPTPEPAG